MELAVRFELTTGCLQGSCSIQLSYTSNNLATPSGFEPEIPESKSGVFPTTPRGNKNGGRYRSRTYLSLVKSQMHNRYAKCPIIGVPSRIQTDVNGGCNSTHNLSATGTQLGAACENRTRFLSLEGWSLTNRARPH